MTSPEKNAFSVDVEDYFHVSAFESVVERSEWESLPSRVVQNTMRMLDILSKNNVTATFFVLGWVAERYPELVREIANAGHEVASHGYSHRKIYNQDRDTFAAEVRRAKALLEDCVGISVLGYRAASFSITRDSLWALDVLVEEGFVYDSSIYPIWHDNYGIPGAERKPSRLTTPMGYQIAELPLSTYRILGVPIPVGGGGYFRLYPYWLTHWLLNSIASKGTPVNFYCHPWELDTEQPKFETAPWRSRFRHYNNIGKFESRLTRLLQDFEFTSCANVLIERDLLARENE